MTKTQAAANSFIAKAEAHLARRAKEKGFANLASYKAFLNARIAAKRAERHNWAHTR